MSLFRRRSSSGAGSRRGSATSKEQRKTKALMAELGDPALISLYTNMLEVEEQFIALRAEVLNFIVSAKSLCGASRNARIAFMRGPALTGLGGDQGRA